MTHEILEGNKLIAEFMNTGSSWVNNMYFGEDGMLYHLDDLKYHFSWAWLMSVVDGIENLGASVIIARMFCEIKYTNPLDDSKSFDIKIASGVKMNASYGAVVEFIKWYNTQKL